MEIENSSVIAVRIGGARQELVELAFEDARTTGDPRLSEAICCGGRTGSSPTASTLVASPARRSSRSVASVAPTINASESFECMPAPFASQKGKVDRTGGTAQPPQSGH